MHKRMLAVLAGAGFLLVAAVPAAPAQDGKKTSGEEPKCPYGYFDFSPYDCAPYGYYGPEWFQQGAFVGIGEWFHGSKDFHGAVDDHYNPHYGYKGTLPRRGDQPDAQHSLAHIQNFVATDERNGEGKPYQQVEKH